jgi:hypothetical protein
MISPKVCVEDNNNQPGAHSSRRGGDGKAEHADPAKGAGYANIYQIQIRFSPEPSLAYFLCNPDFSDENLL